MSRLIILNLAALILVFTSCGSRNKGESGRQRNGTGYRFDFGEGKPVRGSLRAGPADVYPGPGWFGFADSLELRSSELPGGGAEDQDYITCDGPFLFLVDVPEGNYNIRITACGMKGGSLLSVKGESRRLLADNIGIPEGATRNFMVTTNVRFPLIPGGDSVRLKKREVGHLNWDRCLSLEFTGTRPAISSVGISPNDTAITVFLAGNSTVTDQRFEPYSAWGQVLPDFFRPGYISVSNQAESGEALKSFVWENRLGKLESEFGKGDYLFIQFAHNDQKEYSSAYAPPFTDYQEYLKRFIRSAREKGTVPVLVTPMLRRKFDDKGKVINTHGSYPEAMRQVAQEEGVALIDLFSMSKVLYETLGPDGSRKLFVHYPAGSFPGQDEELKDDSHHSSYGAYELASCVMEGIRKGLPDLANYLQADLPEYDPAHPDPEGFPGLPADPVFVIMGR